MPPLLRERTDLKPPNFRFNLITDVSCSHRDNEEWEEIDLAFLFIAPISMNFIEALSKIPAHDPA